MRIVFRFIAIVSLAFTLSNSYAQEYPTRTIRMIVAGPPGQSSDIGARFYAEKLAAMFKQPVVIDNRPGANAIIGVQTVLQAPADGYTIFAAGASPMAMNVALYKTLPYDAVRDFRFVSGMQKGMTVMVVPAKSPYRTVADLIKAARDKPRAINYASYAAVYQLVSEWLAQLGDASFTHVPYKGGAQALTDVAGGRVDFAIADITALPLVQGGQLRALAVTGDQRLARLPDVPTMREAGYPALVHYGWTSLAVRAGTPDPIVRKLSSAFLAIMATSEAREHAARQGNEVNAIGYEEMGAFQIQEIAKFKRVMASAGIQPE